MPAFVTTPYLLPLHHIHGAWCARRQPQTRALRQPQLHHIRACVAGRPATEESALSAAAGRTPSVVFCDVDGTLLGSDNQILQANVDAVKRLPFPRVRFIPATGKSRAGALNSMRGLGDFLKSRYPAGLPGVYLQGLCVYDETGKLVYEQTLDEEISRKVVELSKTLSMSLIAYGRDGDSILCDRYDSEVLKVTDYHEPMPIECGSWESVIGSDSIHKFIFMASEEEILAARPTIEKAFAGIAEITRATPGMLEVLPLGASKGAGVERLQKVLGLSPLDSMAMGDGENDVEMLELVQTSVAMANAVPAAAAAAKFGTLSNDEAGVAAALEEHVFATLE